MTKIITVGDVHLSDRAPVNTTDSYTDDLIEMLYWRSHIAMIGRMVL